MTTHQRLTILGFTMGLMLGGCAFQDISREAPPNRTAQVATAHPFELAECIVGELEQRHGNFQTDFRALRTGRNQARVIMRWQGTTFGFIPAGPKFDWLEVTITPQTIATRYIDVPTAELIERTAWGAAIQCSGVDLAIEPPLRTGA